MEYGFATKQLHAGQTADPATRSCAVPIYQTASYEFEDTAHGAGLFALTQSGHIYSRISNPTVEILEKRLTALEGGVGCVAFSSGMAAITAAIQTLCKAGDNIVSISTLYGGTYTIFTTRLPRMGIEARIVPAEDFAALTQAIDARTRAVYVETLGNPDINIPDFERISAIAHNAGIPVICDNTFGSPYLTDMAACGVDISVHSLTKYVGGHGTSIGGAIIDMGTFNWAKSAFTEFTQPDETYHGVVYADNPAPFALKVRAQALRDYGACLSPFNAFLFLMGLETLSLRVERHCANALAVAEYLQNHPAVAWVNYPALESSPYHARQQKFLPKGAGGILSFGTKGGKAAACKVIEGLTLFSHLANVADARSLVIHPASTTHSQLSGDQLTLAGVKPEGIRLSVGLEDINDIIADLENALKP